MYVPLAVPGGGVTRTQTLVSTPAPRACGVTEITSAGSGVSSRSAKRPALDGAGRGLRGNQDGLLVEAELTALRVGQFH